VTDGDAGFVAVGAGGTVLRSDDACTWEPVDSGTIENFFAVTFGAGSYVAVTSAGNIFASPDAREWHLVYAGDAWLWDVVYADGRFVAVGAGVAVYSFDGLDWNAAPRGSVGAMRGVTWGDGRASG
jgi:hypothetical protein